MISGPTIPNTVHGVRELLTRNAGLIEHGLEVLCEDLVLGEGVHVDVLARDASAAPVCVFIVVPELASGLAGRLLGARTWLQHHASWLAQGVDDPGLDVGKAPRFLVLGLEVPATLVEELRELPCPGLAVQQFCSYSIAGVRHLGVTDLIAAADPLPSRAGLPQPESVARAGSAAGGAAVLPRADAATGLETPLETSDTFTVPEGVTSSTDRAVCARFLDLCSRIDPGIRVQGDRFRRVLRYGNQELAELALQPEGLAVRVAGLDLGAGGLLHADNCVVLVDAVMRALLSAVAGVRAPTERDAQQVSESRSSRAQLPSPQPQSSSRLGLAPASEFGRPADAGAAEEVVPTSADSQPGQSVSRPPADRRRFSLEPIRRSVAAAQLSHEEFTALGEAGSDEQQGS